MIEKFIILDGFLDNFMLDEILENRNYVLKLTINKTTTTTYTLWNEYNNSYRMYIELGSDKIDRLLFLKGIEYSKRRQSICVKLFKRRNLRDFIDILNELFKEYDYKFEFMGYVR